MDWWNSLSSIEQWLWGFVFISSGIFIIQTALSFLGFGEVEIDTEVGLPELSEGLSVWNFITLRNVVAFMLGGSWTSALMYDPGSWIWAPLTVLVGLGFSTGNIFIAKNIKQLESQGNLSIHDAVNQEGIVTIAINPSMQGRGKVQVSVSGRSVELPAMTEDSKELRRGDPIVVYDVTEDVLKVSRITSIGE